MITAKAFGGRHFAVYGLARSGLATVEALLASGAKVTAWDGKEEARDRLRSSLAEGRGGGPSNADSMVEGSAPNPSTTAFGSGPPPHASHREELEFADLDTADLSQFDSLVVTPGLPLNRHPIAARAREAGVEIIGDIELFARARTELPPHKVVGITGTNGKSTTTALVHHILQTAGVPATMGGNIGLPILAQDPLPEGGVYVLELSSYQIDLTKSLDCDVAVLLNITPDHLDRYESFEAYAASKVRLFSMQSERQFQVVDTGNEASFGLTDETEDPAIIFFNMPELVGVIDHDRQSRWPALQGPHNAANAAAAIGVAKGLDLSPALVERGLETFTGLPHRMERVREIDCVLFVNDSKATNAEAAAPALAAYPKIRWILGGQAKAETLGDTAAQLGHVVHAYTIGEAGPMFARLLREAGVAVSECESLENAVKMAARDSQPGETVLLSPVSASFDQFRDFEERGDRFRQLVGAL